MTACEDKRMADSREMAFWVVTPHKSNSIPVVNDRLGSFLDYLQAGPESFIVRCSYLMIKDLNWTSFLVLIYLTVLLGYVLF